MKKKNIVPAIIWKESIYKNNFKCKCGAKLADNSGVPTNNLGGSAEDTEDNRLFCMKCKNLVAVERYVPIDVGEGSHLMGNWG